MVIRNDSICQAAGCTIVVGDLTIQATGSVTITGNVAITGDLAVTGALAVTGSLTLNGSRMVFDSPDTQN